MNLNIFKSSFIYAAIILASPMVSSCNDDDVVVPEFSIDDIDLSSYEVVTDCNGFGLSTTGYIDRSAANKYVVRSNTSWQLVPQGDDAEWIILHPAKGDKDGTFYLAVKENKSYYERYAELTIEVNGSDEHQVIRVNQTGAEPSLFATDNTVLRGNGGDLVIGVTANLNWTCELDNSCSWLSIDSVSDTQIMLTALPNDTEDIRTTTIEILSEDCPELNRTVTISQYGATLIFYDDFEYMGGSNLSSWSDSNTQTNMIKWSEEQLAAGWSAWHDTYFDTDAATNETSTLASLVYRGTYDGNSWLKLGKTSWCGTAVSPPLTALADGETVDVTVSFCACPFRGGGNKTTNPGKLDTNYVMVGVYGPGEVENSNYVMKDVNVKYVVSAESVENKKLPYAAALAAAKSDMSGDYPVVKFEMNNYPPGTLADHNFCDKPLDPSVAQHTLKVKGVTNKTQIVFFGGGYDYLNEDSDTKISVIGISGKSYTTYRVNKANRVFLDNVMVNIVK